MQLTQRGATAFAIAAAPYEDVPRAASWDSYQADTLLRAQSQLPPAGSPGAPGAAYAARYAQNPSAAAEHPGRAARWDASPVQSSTDWQRTVPHDAASSYSGQRSHGAPAAGPDYATPTGLPRGPAPSYGTGQPPPLDGPAATLRTHLPARPTPSEFGKAQRERDAALRAPVATQPMATIADYSLGRKLGEGSYG